MAAEITLGRRKGGGVRQLKNVHVGKTILVVRGRLYVEKRANAELNGLKNLAYVSWSRPRWSVT